MQLQQYTCGPSHLKSAGLVQGLATNNQLALFYTSAHLVKSCTVKSSMMTASSDVGQTIITNIILLLSMNVLSICCIDAEITNRMVSRKQLVL